MGEASHAAGEEFGGQDERCGVGAKVEEELLSPIQSVRSANLWMIGGENQGGRKDANLSDGETNEFSSCADALIAPRNHGKHQGRDDEPLNLYPPPSYPFNEIYGHKVPGHVSRNSNNQIANSVPLQFIILILPGQIANLIQDNRLIEIRAIECDIE